jgi:hypothetical protein
LCVDGSDDAVGLFNVVSAESEKTADVELVIRVGHCFLLSIVASFSKDHSKVVLFWKS